ncbi:MAG TPA: aminopeptidase, partial [Hyphomonadaceae bacterium]|nr:aminopeptidase [Hyphomonadaceae bacterium]
MKVAWFAAFAAILFCAPAWADANKQTKGNYEDKFRQLEVDLPTPNTYRAASGAPGEAYWQQEADHVINATLDENAKRITASETVTYKNNSPHALSYAWFQLDQNQFKQDSVTRRTATTTPAANGGDVISMTTLRQLQSYTQTPHGYEIQSVTDGAGNALHYVINDTMMRVDMPRPLRPGQTQVFK